MKRIINMAPMAGLVIALSSCTTRYASEAAVGPPYYASGPMAGEPASLGWPRFVVIGSTTNVIYEPQADSWDGHQLMARAGLAVQSSGHSQPAFGVVALQAITLVDKTTRTVTLENIKILGGDFPSAGQQIQSYVQKLRGSFPRELPGLSLDRLEGNFAVAPQQLRASAGRLNNAPPKVIFDTKPAILVCIDGPPAYRRVAGTSLQRVINTRLLFLKDTAGQFYLHVLDGYMKAPSLKGPWTVAAKPPSGAAEAERQATTSATPADLLVGQTDSPSDKPTPLTENTAPGICVSTTPAELILFDGEPDFVPIAGTRLLYAANTTGNVFKSLSDQRTYLLISGRWFGAPSLAGPWQFVPADHLPPGFAAIPDDSPKENVKASLPGTPQATEALIENVIPEGIKVPRSMRMQDPQIDGPPQLTPIAGTPLYHVANSGTPIIEVDAHSWYACQNGVWFVASSLNGPWTIADSVPAVIYSIPADSPMHYLTYVQVYGATSREVYEGYTPGYLGTEMEDGVVVYGTGYDYAPWIGAVWYAAPCTWGLGWGPCWTPWDDWCFDFGFGWGCGFGGFGWRCCHPPMPWWGPCRGGHHDGVGLLAWGRSDSASTAGSIYTRAGTRGERSPFPRITDTTVADHYGRAYNSRTGELAAGQGVGVPSEFRSLESRAERTGYWGYGATIAQEGGYPHYGGIRSSDWGGKSLVASQHAPKSPFAKRSSANTMKGYGDATLFDRHAAGGWSRYFTAGSHSHNFGHTGGYAHGGGYSHGGWGSGGGHGGGGGGGGHR
jgi:hypothetical protein